MLECVAVEIFFQIPWRYLRLQSVTSLRYIVLVLLVIMGTINVYSVWRLCMEVHDCVISLQEPGQLTSPLLYLAMLTAMLHSIVLSELVTRESNLLILYLAYLSQKFVDDRKKLIFKVYSIIEAIDLSTYSIGMFLLVIVYSYDPPLQ